MSENYEFNVTLDLAFDAAMEKLKSAAMAEKLGVVSEVDVAAIMRAKLEKDIGHYRILGLCAPALALKVIEAEPNAGVLLPCNVILRSAGDKTVIAFMAPKPVLGMSDNPALAEVADTAHEKLLRIVENLQTV